MLYARGGGGMGGRGGGEGGEGRRGRGWGGGGVKTPSGAEVGGELQHLF